MKWKSPHLKDQFDQSPEKLKEVMRYFQIQSLAYGIEPVCTRLWDPFPGESGVHPDRRGADFRDETRGRGGEACFLYPREAVQVIVDALNDRFPRDDGKKVCIYHEFDGGPAHFHLQIMKKWV
jgi:hypothetical protein